MVIHSAMRIENVPRGLFNNGDDAESNVKRAFFKNGDV
ncbi:predicted protein [Sclerotinia sclerotiorum 1980 UF-70]|uniref:Uncharacterized protein n=1 Tax=Sclerotinia sclerotiorum (strain ATCC 18683 / 1980 / Ss-1) TaxID=665079 RepID=A7E9Z5_SCLS1|nr:predicted protein [Sclerotinia sclerotiorum 1980 UF-70]EDN99273.1 predicted protein [Sclerotinia sclerotiorum 1980 UF-70]